MFWLIFYESNVWDGNLRSALFRLVKMQFSRSHARQREATWSPSLRCQPMSASSCRWETPSLALWAFWMVALTLIETTLLPTHPILSWVRHQHRCTILLHGHQRACPRICWCHQPYVGMRAWAARGASAMLPCSVISLDSIGLTPSCCWNRNWLS